MLRKWGQNYDLTLRTTCRRQTQCMVKEKEEKISKDSGLERGGAGGTSHDFTLCLEAQTSRADLKH